MPDNLISMDVVRRLAIVSARISSGSDLTVTLQAVADGVVEVVGFGTAAVNYRLPSGDFAVVAIAGPDEVKAALMGGVAPRAAMDRLLARSDAWGSLRFNSSDPAEDEDVPQWVPDIPVSDDPDAWQPLDMLLAPMWARDGDLIGVISVDEPPGGKRPAPQVCELLEIFALQAGLAIAAVELRERFTAERASREELLLDLAHRDALTGLANRRALEDRLTHSTQLAARTRRPGALLFCDVDQLKHLNDQYGHHHGDAILLACAQAINAHVRAGDLVSRIGGDEFVVVADGITSSAATALAQRLRGLVISADDSDTVNVTMSVGVAIIDGQTNGASLIAEADAAMYRDKHKPT
jgi:diguanylate cyclase (GGDEF)-like protein